MITRQPYRIVASTFGEPGRISPDAEKSYRWRFAPYARAREDGQSVPAAASAVGISLETAKQYERDIAPAAADTEPAAAIVLGPTEQAILGHLVTCDGLTAAEIGERLGRTARSVQRSVNSLDGKCCIAVLTYRAGIGTAARVWGATTAGRAALEAHQQEGAAS